MQKDFIQNRFKSVNGFAPLTLGCPANVITVDYSVFIQPDKLISHRTIPLRIPSRKRPKLVTIFKGSF